MPSALEESEDASPRPSTGQSQDFASPSSRSAHSASQPSATHRSSSQPSTRKPTFSDTDDEFDEGIYLSSLCDLSSKLYIPNVAIRVDMHEKTYRRRIRHTSGQPVKLDARADSGKDVYRIASLSKPLISLLYCIIIVNGLTPDDRQPLEWKTRLIPYYNSLCGEEGSEISKGFRNPTILETLLHMNAFPDMNQFLFAPDGKFMADTNYFIDHFQTISDAVIGSAPPTSLWYSTTNYILAVIFLEKLFPGKTIAELVKTYIFDQLGMECSRMEPFKPNIDGATVLPGYHVSADLFTRHEVDLNLLGGTSIAAACFGTWSCTDDLAAFFLGLMDRAFGESSTYSGPFVTEEVAKTFFNLRFNLTMGEKMDDKRSWMSKLFGEPKQEASASTFAGVRCDVTSKLIGTDSPNALLDSEVIKPLGKYIGRDKGVRLFWKYRKRENGKNLVFTKGGVVDGFTCRVLLSPAHRLCIIVLANATAPIDLPSCAAQSILQHALRLDDNRNIAQEVMKELGSLCEPLRDLQRKDADEGPWTDKVDKFIGTYRSRVAKLNLTITEGGAFLHTAVGETTQMKVNAWGDYVRLRPSNPPFCIERWAPTAWKVVTFKLEIEGNKTVLKRGNPGKKTADYLSTDYFDKQ